MEVMYSRSGKRYEVYAIDIVNNKAKCFDTDLAKKSGGNGWVDVKLSKLIPEKYYNVEMDRYMSMNERRTAKDHLTLIDATWQCDDGTKYPHSMIEQAISHQAELLARKAELLEAESGAPASSEEQPVT